MRSLLFISMISMCCLSGCSQYVTAAKGYAGAAADTARSVEDLKLDTLKFTLCATPYSAIERNPEFAAAIKALCSGGIDTPASGLLDSIIDAKAAESVK